MPADTWHLGDWPTARWIPVAPEEMEDAASLHVGLIQDDRMIIIHQGYGSAVLFPVEILGALSTAIDLLLAPGETVDAEPAPRGVLTAPCPLNRPAPCAFCLRLSCIFHGPDGCACDQRSRHYLLAQGVLPDASDH